MACCLQLDSDYSLAVVPYNFLTPLILLFVSKVHVHAWFSIWPPLALMTVGQVYYCRAGIEYSDKYQLLITHSSTAIGL